MKEFVFNRQGFQLTEQDISDLKISCLEGIIEEHVKVFQWMKDNPNLHLENVRKEILRLLEECND